MTTFPESVANHFWAKVVCENGCWNWTGAQSRSGYGRFSIRTEIGIVNYRAHRLAWALMGYSIPPDKELCHSCDNRLCVNPYHIFLGTHQENMADAQSKGRLYTAPERPHLPVRGPETIELEDDFFDETKDEEIESWDPMTLLD